MDDKYKKAIVLGVVLLYAISPVDLFPGPVDDIIVAIIGAFIQSRFGKSEQDETYK